MPIAPRPPCAIAGCKNRKPCPIHKRRRPAGYGRPWRDGPRAQVLAEEATCRRCGAAFDANNRPHVDHIRPRAQGGSDARENLEALCESCHNRKTATEDGGFGR